MLGLPVLLTSVSKKPGCSVFWRGVNDRFFGKENTYFEAVNNQEQYFGGHENICCMVFLNNMPMTWSHIAFNIHLDLIYDQCYPLNAKTKSFCFTFAVVIANSISFDYSRFLTS